MDCVIPGSSVRTFCAAITCLSRIGKDMYVEYNPLNGLVLKTITDAKSAYSCFHWKPSFFETCSTSVRRVSRKRRGRSKRDDEDEDLDDDDDDDDNFSCRVALRSMSAIVKSRKGRIQALRIRDEVSANHLFLSFEFQIQRSSISASSSELDDHPEAPEAFLFSVVHRVGVAEAQGVRAVAERDGCSEIVTSPRLLLRMLEPIRQATSMSLIINDKARLASASSFHRDDVSRQQTGTDNALINATTARIVKTETTIACDEFDEFEFRDHNDEDAPDNVNEEVVIVFGLKETKAFLSFCAQASGGSSWNQTTPEDGNSDVGGLAVELLFHYGGKPIVFESKTKAFSVELIMATLDHKFLP